MRSFPVPRELATLVEDLVVVDHQGQPDNATALWRIVPDGAPHLLLHLLRSRDGSVGRVRFRVVGARTVFKDTDVHQRVATVGVRLIPGALPRVIGDRADTLTDSAADAEPFLGPTTAQFLDQVSECRDLSSVVQSLTAALGARLASRPPIDWRVRMFSELAKEHVSLTIGDAARRLRVSERSLRNTVREQTGMAPKRFLRIGRLQRALDLALERKSIDAAVAQAAGYHDQPQMIREFVDLLGETPSCFLRRAQQSG